ncbi:SdrD B-like domain-containing protein [uncultured Kordia sp.]|uniref:SdrD B-like domain-containing protein n=1 Tax=uncultured Kordia sp. TaxID=507699 RepID=UPI00260C934C|nr:SdrD B-like domain-containing protein [uncultured Kordia sp.]
MKTKITLLVLTALLGLTTVFANSMPTSENVVENEMMTTADDNLIIISAGKRIYSLDMNTYNATLLATSPYVNEINSIATDASTGWFFYVSNHISSYNWTVYGYNVHSNVHKNFGSVRNFFTSSGHAYSSRGLASGGATFYNGKLYFAMEYPVYCYYYRDGRRTTSNSNPKDELDNNPRSAGTVSTGMFTRGTDSRNSSTEADETDNGGRDGNGETPADFVVIEAEEANAANDNVNDYIPEEELPDAETEGQNPDEALQQRGDRNSYQSESYSYNYYHSSYNNNIYLLEISFNGLSDISGQTTSVANGTPVYDNWWYSSFLYKGELGDIVVGDNGQMYAATSYQVQAYNFNSNRYDWANNEDIYAQMAKDKHSNLQLLKNKRTYTTYYYYGCPQNSYVTKSYVQKYTAPSSLRTYNNIQLGALNEITGLNPEDVGQITDASDYVNLTPPVSYKVKGIVYDDNNENGNFNGGQGETLTSGVTVTLYADNNNDGALDSGDTVIDSQATDANGAYVFNNIDVANTLVQVTVPNNTTTTTYTSTTPEVVAVAGGTNDVTVDFGINEALIPVNYDVFGTVYDDNNEDAVFDNGEAGLANVTLTLYNDTNADGVLDTTDTLIATTTSGTDGSYSFLHVCVQNTIVAVTVPTNTGDFTYTLTTAGTQAIDAINTDVTGVDFGVNEEQVISYAISGNVYDDNDESGAQDAGEDNLDAITVTLYNDSNANGAVDAGEAVIATATTAVDGTYSFAGVTVQNTVVAVTVPGNTADFTYVLTTAGEVNTSSTNVNVDNVNFGINEEQVINYAISGNVYDDNDESGAQDAGEDNLDAITVTLYDDSNANGAVDAGEAVIATATTAVDGTYSFAGVTVQNTVVAVTVPGNTADFTYTLTTAGEINTSSTNVNVDNVNFGINEVEVIDYNISGVVFDDDNDSGDINPSEGRIQNVVVRLYEDVNADGNLDTNDNQLATTATGSDGTYQFSNVTNRNTLVEFTIPGNSPNFTYRATTPEVVAVTGTTTDVTDVNFGVNEEQVIDYSISGTVFDDDNENGTQDAGEGTLDGITVTLYADNNADGNLDVADTTLTSTTTGTNGAYSFSNITTENVLAVVTVPGNTATFTYVLTTSNTQAVSSLITDVNGLDFGVNENLVIDYNISGTVYDDDNANGVNDTEAGLDAITVKLYSDNDASGTLTAGDGLLEIAATATDGTYSFTNVTTQFTLVGVEVPANTTDFTYTATTAVKLGVSSTITDVTDQDFGINKVQIINYNISGNVFDDDNQNTAIDAGERALENVTLTLYADNDGNGRVGGADTVISTTTSANDGTYSFSNVTVERTVVAITVPANTPELTYTLTTAASANTSSTTADVNNVDFGVNREEIILYNISGTVFDDDDASGVRETGEGFIGAVTLTLYNDVDGNGRLGAADTVIGTTTTSTMSGAYNFTGVTVRNTLVAVTVPTDTATFTYTLTTSGTLAISSTITDVNNQDFGIDRAAIVNYNIFGTVYDDDNENANLDSTEAGRLENVTLTLYVDDDADGRLGSGDTVIETTTSAADGTYSFLNVTVENTVVAITIPQNTADYIFTLTTDARLNISSVNTDVTNQDFGVNKVATTYTVSGNVFNDENGDGANASTEAGLRGVTVNLYEDVNGNGRIDRGEPLIATTASDRSGNYQFSGITATNVIVQVVVPSNTADFTFSATTPVNVVLTGGVSTTVDFGIQRTVVILYNISGVIWDDQNSDQVKDPSETRLVGIGVTLFEDVNADGALDAGDRSLSTITTSTTGGYQFSNVNLRNVLVVPTLPADGTFTTPDNRAISSINTDAVDVDFGIRIANTLYQVTGVVFNDQNENGVADPGEESLNGLPVEIYADSDSDGVFDPNLDALVAFTQTSNGGFGFLDPNYLVDDIPPGEVFIVVVLPEDTIFETYTNTYDPDSGTASPDGIYRTVMVADLFNIDFGVKYENTNSTSRANNGDVMFTNGSAISEAPEDVSERLRLYPNPTVRQIAINAEEFSGDVNVEIYNDRGYKVMSTTVSQFAGEYKIGVERLAPGMYYAQFEAGNKRASKKFIKQ